MPQVLATLAAWWRHRVRGTARRRDLSDAGGYLLLGLALHAAGLVGIWTGRATVTGDERWWFAAPLVTACALLFARRRAPIGALLGGLVVVAVDGWLGGSTGVLLVALDLMYSAAIHARPAAARWLQRVVIVAIVGGTATPFVLTGDVAATVNVGLLLFALLGTPLWWGLSVRRQGELAALTAAAAVREERTRMARDLHDALAGNLSAVAMHAAGALARPEAAERDERAALLAVRESALAALEDVQAMVHVLRSDPEEVTAPPRLAEAAGLLTEARARGLRVTAELPSPGQRLPDAVDQAAYRLLQEALTNAAKHAPAARVDVRVTVDPDRVRLEVSNAPRADGVASPAVPSGGLGLLTMRERASGLGGTVEAGWDGEPRRWRVRAELPLPVGEPGPR